MLDIDPVILKSLLELAPLFVILGMIVTWFYSRIWNVEYGVFIPGEAYLEQYSDFGGHGPLFIAAVGGIAWGVLLETVLIVLLAIGYVSTDLVTSQDWLAGSVLAVLFGAGIGYWQFLKIQSDIREGDWYRGWP